MVSTTGAPAQVASLPPAPGPESAEVRNSLQREGPGGRGERVQAVTVVVCYGILACCPGLFTW